MYNKKFLTATAERAIKTFAQTLLALVGADSANVLTASTTESLKVALGAAALSVLSSFASGKIGTNGPSLAGESLTEDAQKSEESKPASAPAKKAPAKKAPAKKAAAKKKAAPAKKK